LDNISETTMYDAIHRDRAAFYGMISRQRYSIDQKICFICGANE